MTTGLFLVACAPAPEPAASPLLPDEELIELPTAVPNTRTRDPILVWDVGWNEVREGGPTEGQALAILRRALRRRGLPAEVFNGPMGYVPSPDHPDAETALDGAELGDLMLGWPAKAALVVTMQGRWWVWDYGSTAPADALAKEIVASIPSRGL